MTVASNLRTRKFRRPKTSKEERICSICSKGFNKAEHLSRHYRTHTRERPFQCSACGRVYTRQDTLLRHVRTSCAQKKAGGDSLPDCGTTIQGAAVDPPVSRSPELTNSNLATASLTDAFGPEIQAAFVPVEDTNSGNPLGAINTASPLLESSTLSNQLDIHSFAASDVELETGWASWLLCDDFNLDAVNSSLLQATAEGTQRLKFDSPIMVPQPIEGRSMHGNHSIRRKWHTYCEPNPAGRVTPDHTLEDGRIDECYREELAERLKPRVQTGILPSTTFIHLCLRAYFRHFQPIFPIVHEPTFHPCKHNAVLLLSICSIGSLFLGSPRAIDHGISMFERLQKANVSSWEVHIASPSDARIAAIQSAIIGQTFGFLVGRPKDLNGIDFFHGGVAAWGRRAITHRTEPALCDLTDLVGDALENAWKNWAITETKKRIGLAIAIQDAELAKLHHHESVLRHGCERLKITSSDKLFAAPNPTAWKRLMPQESCHNITQPPAFSTTSGFPCTLQIPKGVSSFEQCAMLESISVLAYESHQPTVFESNKAEKCQELLIDWYRSWESEKASNMAWSSPLKILWHSSFIMLYANLDALERACGRDGGGIDLEALQYAQQWAMSSEAKRCLLHAVYITRFFESMAIGSTSPIHLPLCLYQCGIILFCFAKFGGKAALSVKDIEAQLTHPEFQLLGAGTGGQQILEGESGTWQREWDTSEQLFTCVDLLRRIPHWKLPLSLASTLLALIEEEEDIF